MTAAGGVEDGGGRSEGTAPGGMGAEISAPLGKSTLEINSDSGNQLWKSTSAVRLSHGELTFTWSSSHAIN